MTTAAPPAPPSDSGASSPSRAGFWQRLRRIVDSSAASAAEQGRETGTDWFRAAPMILMHVACLAVIWVGWSWFAVIACLALYVLRMFGLTAFYHRYFSHRAFKANRFWQFCFAAWGGMAVQRGALWWAANHRHHHRYSDKPEDVHSPRQRGFWYSHIGWVTDTSTGATRWDRIRDLKDYPELRFLNRFHLIMPVLLALGLYALGAWLETAHPGLGTNGWQMVVWGFVISTVILWHGTFTINSLSHKYGTQRYDTGDDSRNNVWLALLTLGEGWHNNHHHYSASARQGFYWWEIDLSWYVLKVMAALRIIHDLKPVPEGARNRDRIQPASVHK